MTLPSRLAQRLIAAWHDRAGWKQLMKNGMARDFSWTRQAREYEELYRRLVERA